MTLKLGLGLNSYLVNTFQDSSTAVEVLIENNFTFCMFLCALLRLSSCCNGRKRFGLKLYLLAFLRNKLKNDLI